MTFLNNAENCVHISHFLENEIISFGLISSRKSV